MKSIFTYSESQWRELLHEYGPRDEVLKRALKRTIFRTLGDFNPLLFLKKEQWAYWSEHLDFSLPEKKERQIASDGTEKFLTSFSDGNNVETVLIPFRHRPSVCVSTQVGCGMNCQFCFTAKMGLKRQLQFHEIVGQFLLARKDVYQANCNPNLVLMGQGEPLHNFEAVKEALCLLTDRDAVGLGAKHITLSTVGYLPGLIRFRELPPVNLALSLHSAIEEKRRELIPQSKQSSLNDLQEFFKSMNLKRWEFLTFEYLVIKGVNDSAADVEALTDYVSRINSYYGENKILINLIPFNPFPGALVHYKRPSPADIERFASLCRDKRLRTLVRQTKGSDIMAACGQLQSALPTA
jgi:23S rRNA (adenine2503-C2)-methyltransferase